MAIISGVTISGGGVTILGGGAPATDPYFMYNSLLLPGNGTNTAQNNTFLDGSTNNFTITRNGNTTQGTFSPYGANWSNYFDGNGDYLTTQNNAAFNLASNNFTIETFFYTGSTSDQVIISAWNTTSFEIIYFSGTLYCQTNSSAPRLTTTTWPLNQWNHIAFVRSGNTYSAYLNGTRFATATDSQSVPNINAAPTIGVRQGGTSFPFNGYLSNLRVVNGTAVYDPTLTTLTVPTAPLTAITNTSLLTCQNNRFIDNSTNVFAITVNGDTNIQRFSPFSPTQAYDTSTIGGSGYFDGTTSNIITTNTVTTIGTQDFCLEAWVYCFSTTSYACIIGNDTPGGGAGWFIEMGTTRGIYLGGPEVSLGSAQYNRWVHLVFCRVSGTYGGFVNGVRQATGSLTNNYSTAVKIGINNYVVGSSSGFGTTGYISDGRVTVGSSPYSPSSTTITVPTAPLTAVSNTVFLANMTNAGIIDNAMMNDLQTVGNAQISTTQSKFGGSSMYFDGSGDYLLSNAPSTQLYSYGGDFTIELWLYRNATGQTILVDSRPTGGGFANPYYVLFVNGSSVAIWNTSNTNRITGTTTISNSTWYHIAVSRSGSSTKLFVNGTQDGSTYTDSTALICATSRPYIGIDANDGTSALNGYIDDLRVTKGYARYTSNFTAPTTAFPLN